MMLLILDSMFVLLSLICWFLPMSADKKSFLLGFMCHFLLSLMPLLFGCFFLQWIRRYKSNKKRQRLLALPHETIRDQIFSVSVAPDEAGTVSYSALSGYTVGPRVGDFYAHYQYRTDPVVYSVRASVNTYRHGFVDFYALPRDFSSRFVKIEIPKDANEITYVTDSDGKKYFVSASRN